MNTGLTSLIFPSLIKNYSQMFLFTNQNLTTISFPKLDIIKTLYISSNKLLNTFAIPKLAKVGTFIFSNNNSINSISFPSLISLNDSLSGQFSITDCLNLSSISLPVLTEYKAINFNTTRNKLSSTTINHILNKLVNISPFLSCKSFSLNNNSRLTPQPG